MTAVMVESEELAVPRPNPCDCWTPHGGVPGKQCPNPVTHEILWAHACKPGDASANLCKPHLDLVLLNASLTYCMYCNALNSVIAVYPIGGGA